MGCVISLHPNQPYDGTTIAKQRRRIVTSQTRSRKEGPPSEGNARRRRGLSHQSSDATDESSQGDICGPPPPRDSVGDACMELDCFSCSFPCAIVDIDDTDQFVVDKLSREKAMDAMYRGWKA